MRLFALPHTDPRLQEIHLSLNLCFEPQFQSVFDGLRAIASDLLMGSRI